MNTSTRSSASMPPLSGFETTDPASSDISGLAGLTNANSRPWPPALARQRRLAPGRARLFEDGRFATPDGRARLQPLAQRFPSGQKRPRLRGAVSCSSTAGGCGISGTP